jgi:hypothetical protein
MSGMLNHTNEPGKCFAESINSLAEDCDHEYHISALGPLSGTLERAKRGRLRILEAMIVLESLNQKIYCFACHEEIKRQTKLQREGILEIERVWNLSE